MKLFRTTWACETGTVYQSHLSALNEHQAFNKAETYGTMALYGIETGCIDLYVRCIGNTNQEILPDELKIISSSEDEGGVN